MLRSQGIYGKHGRAWSNGRIALGRNLFSTLPEDRHDLAPQVGGGGSLILVGDIRLDNRDELGAALSISPSRLSGMPDAALALHCFEAWGEAAVERLNGDFAIALWDEREQRLLLARDFLGQRPLHIHKGKDFFAFASMPKGLHAMPEVPIAPDREAVAAFLALMPETGAETFFTGVEKVLPGHVMTVTRQGVSTHRYWHPPETTLRLGDPRGYEEALRAEMDRAVGARLRGCGGRVGAHLSAGLDSSTVAATAARQLAGQGRVIAYTAVPREGYAGGLANSIADEWPLAAMVAADYQNIEHVKIAASGGSPVEALDRYYFAFERPFLNLCNGIWGAAIMDDARSRGLSVMLTGNVGNMSFSFDGMSALPDMLAEGRLVELARTASALLKNGSRVGTVGAQLFGPFLPRAVWRAISRIRGKGRRLSDYTALNPGLEPRMTEMAKARGLDVSYRPRRDPRATRLWALQRVDQGNYNKGYLGAWGLDLRDPTADRRLIELCLTIPAEQYLAGGVPRSLARRAFADRLPQSLLWERKKGYQAADWHEALTSARAEIADEVERCAAVPASAGLLSTERMRKLVADWPADGWNEPETMQNYRLALLRGTSAAHFVRKASGSNA